MVARRNARLGWNRGMIKAAIALFVLSACGLIIWQAGIEIGIGVLLGLVFAYRQ